MAISTYKLTIILVLLLGCSLLRTKAQDEEAPAAGEGETGPEEPAAGEADPETSEEPPPEETVTEEGEEPTEAGGEEPVGTTEESSPAVKEGGDDEKDSTVEPETTATTTTTTTTPACEPTDHWKISSLIVPPFLQEATNSSNSTTGGGAGQYEGYIVDLLDEISRHLCISYEISLAADGKFGSQQGDDWTGIIGDVVKGDVNVGAGPITVTMNREKAVDFTNPIYSFEAVSVRYRRPGPPDDLQISSTNDLLNEEFKFGVLKGSPIARTLELSITEEHKKLWENINSHRHGLRDSNNDGIRRARWDEKYAFLIEGATADWVLRQPPCDLTSTATGFYKRKYALAVQNQSPLRDKINEALIELQFSNKFEELRAKWWPDECSLSSALTSSLIVIICTALLKYVL